MLGEIFFKKLNILREVQPFNMEVTMLGPKVQTWLKNPQLSDADLSMLCFSPRGCLIGLGASGFTLEEQAAIATVLCRKYGRHMDRARRTYLREEAAAMRRHHKHAA